MGLSLYEPVSAKGSQIAVFDLSIFKRLCDLLRKSTAMAALADASQSYHSRVKHLLAKCRVRASRSSEVCKQVRNFRVDFFVLTSSSRTRKPEFNGDFPR